MSEEKLNIVPIRRVLFEKYSKENVMEEYFIKKLDGCVIARFSNKGLYGNKTEIIMLFYKKNIMVLSINSDIFIDHHMNGEIWNIFDRKFKTNKTQAIEFIQKRRYGVFNFLNCF